MNKIIIAIVAIVFVSAVSASTECATNIYNSLNESGRMVEQTDIHGYEAANAQADAIERGIKKVSETCPESHARNYYALNMYEKVLKTREMQIWYMSGVSTEDKYRLVERNADIKYLAKSLITY